MRNSLPLLGLLFVALSVVGCGGGGSSSPSASSQAHVRFVNSAPDSTSLNLSMNGMVGGSALAYLASTPNFATYAPNSYDVSAQEVTGSQSLWDEVDTFSAATDYVVLAYGQENYGTETQKRLQTLTLPVDISVPNGSKSRIIVVNAFSEAPGFQTPAIDFQDGSNPQYPLTDIPFGSSQSELVNSGTISFEALRDGSQEVYAQDTPGTNFVAGKTYLALVTGVEGDSGTEAPKIVYIALD